MSTSGPTWASPFPSRTASECNYSCRLRQENCVPHLPGRNSQVVLYSFKPVNLGRPFNSFLALFNPLRSGRSATKSSTQPKINDSCVSSLISESNLPDLSWVSQNCLKVLFSFSFRRCGDCFKPYTIFSCLQHIFSHRTHSP